MRTLSSKFFIETYASSALVYPPLSIGGGTVKAVAGGQQNVESEGKNFCTVQ